MYVIQVLNKYLLTKKRFTLCLFIFILFIIYIHNTTQSILYFIMRCLFFFCYEWNISQSFELICFKSFCSIFLQFMIIFQLYLNTPPLCRQRSIRVISCTYPSCSNGTVKGISIIHRQMKYKPRERGVVSPSLSPASVFVSP